MDFSDNQYNPGYDGAPQAGDEAASVRIAPSSNIDRFGSQFNETPDDENTGDFCGIKVIGVGGGGNNAVNHMYRQGIKNVSFVVLNTDRQALKNSPVPTKVEIGDGKGAGNKVEKARTAAETDITKIENLFDNDTRMVFITAGMGGGTGTGASPVVARVAREKGILTIGIVTIPFGFEGERKIIKAYAGANELAKYVDALLVINNQRLTEIYGDLDFMNAFGKADDTLTTAARSISELITDDGYMNVDFNDVDTTLRDGGAAIISCGYGEGENRVTKAIEDALNSPLLRNRDIFGSKKLLFHIFFSQTAENPFKMSEADELTTFVSGISSDVDVIWGLGFDETLGDKVKITILAAGFDVSIGDEAAPSQRIQMKAASTAAATPAVTPQAATPAPTKKRQEPIVVDPVVSGQKEAFRRQIENDYGFEGMGGRYVVMSPDQLDDDNIIEELERNPTYNRDKRVVARLKNLAGSHDHISSTGPADDTAASGKISF